MFIMAVGIQEEYLRSNKAERKLTKTFMMILNWKEPLVYWFT